MSLKDKKWFIDAVNSPLEYGIIASQLWPKNLSIHWVSAFCNILLGETMLSKDFKQHKKLNEKSATDLRFLCVKVSSVREMSFKLKLESDSLYHHRLSHLKPFLINSNFRRKCQTNNGSSCTGSGFGLQHTQMYNSSCTCKFLRSRTCGHTESLQCTHGLWKTPTVLTDEAEYTMEPEDRDLNRDLTGKQHASALAGQQTSHKENSRYYSSQRRPYWPFCLFFNKTCLVFDWFYCNYYCLWSTITTPPMLSLETNESSDLTAPAGPPLRENSQRKSKRRSLRPCMKQISVRRLCWDFPFLKHCFCVEAGWCSCTTSMCWCL